MESSAASTFCLELPQYSTVRVVGVRLLVSFPPENPVPEMGGCHVDAGLRTRAYQLSKDPFSL